MILNHSFLSTLITRYYAIRLPFPSCHLHEHRRSVLDLRILQRQQLQLLFLIFLLLLFLLLPLLCLLALQVTLVRRV